MKRTLFLTGIIVCSFTLTSCKKDSTDQNSNQSDSGVGQSSQVVAPAPKTNMIRTENQPPANTIYVREIYLEFPGYVALHRLNNDGSLGGMIGITHAIEGSKEQIDVTITEKVSNGDQIVVVMYQDDGDIRFTSPETDTIITDNNNNPIQSTITIDNSPPIIKTSH